MSLSHMLPKGPAGRARHGKRLSQEEGTSPFVIIGLPDTGGAATNAPAGPVGPTGGAAVNLGAGAAAPSSTTVTVVQDGSSVLTTLGASSTAITLTSSTPSTKPPPFSISSTSTSVPSSTSDSVTSVPAPSGVSSASISSPTGQNPQDASSSSGITTSKGVSPAAIVGILIFVGIAIIAASVYFIRKRMMAKRQQKRATRTWTTNMFVTDAGGGIDSSMQQRMSRYANDGETGNYLASRPPNTDLSSSSVPSTLRPGQGRTLSDPLAVSTSGAPKFTVPPPPTQSGAGHSSSSLTIPPSTFTASGGGVNRTAIVRCTYIPRLPDELSITTGETIQVNNTYDDGWALCTNERGDQGVVPMDCLNAVENGARQSVVGGRRESSLFKQ